MALPYANLLSLILDHFNLITNLQEVDYSGPQTFSNNILPPLGIFKVGSKYELYSNLSVAEKKELQKLHGKKIGRLEPHSKSHTTHSRPQSLDSEVCQIKVSLLELRDKVSKLTSMLDTLMKDMKGMVVEEVIVEEDVKEEPAKKDKKVSKEGKATQEGKKAEEEEKEEKEKEEKEQEIDATPSKQFHHQLLKLLLKPLRRSNPRPLRRGRPSLEVVSMMVNEQFF